ncbi:DUF2202 domain-containing protein [Sulfurovum sp. XGS-02]|uniref:DUF2202 domain-containing protein n=1 Tax=Sulfurovum sp. XGS-02 TaxID=2925411 RepID=UPI002065E9C4|nr:DUF2202 domain-containing protein [Sulfurovum sp. XGS-02]UPT78558.1 DUF2202 domain-containing protein [Sulfurovum sp. XGS-02]
MSSKPDRTSVLTEEQKDMLFFIYQEEKVARDVYITLGKMYKNENTFRSMQITEQRHLECAKELCDIYGVDTSSMDESVIGAFESPLLKMLYDAYIEKGKSSLRDALEMAEFIGASDTEMIEHASIGMPNDVVSVYEKLKKGNMNRPDTYEAVIYTAA